MKDGNGMKAPATALLVASALLSSGCYQSTRLMPPPPGRPGHAQAEQCFRACQARRDQVHFRTRDEASAQEALTSCARGCRYMLATTGTCTADAPMCAQDRSLTTGSKVAIGVSATLAAAAAVVFGVFLGSLSNTGGFDRGLTAR